MTTSAAASTCAPPLQALSEAAAAAWLLQWAGRVGFMATRVAARHSRGQQARKKTVRCTSTVPCVSVTPLGGCMRQDSKQTAVPVLRVSQEGMSVAGGSRTGRVPLGAAPGQPHLQHNAGQTNVGRFSGSVQGSMIRQCGGDLSGSCVPAAMDGITVTLNTGLCSSYLRVQLPPILVTRVLDTACKTLSEEVTLGGRESSVPDHQVGEWARRAPVLLSLATSLSATNYPLDLTGLSTEALRDILPYVEEHFPVERLCALSLPRKKGAPGISAVEGEVLGRLLGRSTLVALTLNLDAVKGSVLSEISRMSLQELELCGGRNEEGEVLQGLCGLPYTTLTQAVEAIRGGHIRDTPVCSLRKSLQRLTISLPGLPSTMYQVFLAVFHNLHHYSPPSGALASVSGYARMVAMSGTDKSLNLISLNLGRASTHDILEAARVCPALRDVSLSIELDCEETLHSLRSCERLSGVHLAYYPPSVSAPPKVDGRVLLPLLEVLGQRIVSVGLTGFNLRGGVVATLADLPELRRLKLTDSWLAHPDVVPSQPFASLDTLVLNFMPPENTLQLLMAGSCLRTLDIDMVASEARTNCLSDANLKQLVHSKAITSVHSFSSSSPFLTLASLRHLAALPSLRNVGRLSRWGITQDELHCVGHSGPPHLLCRT